MNLLNDFAQLGISRAYGNSTGYDFAHHVESFSTKAANSTGHSAKELCTIYARFPLRYAHTEFCFYREKIV
jgi:hypothetical protein